MSYVLTKNNEKLNLYSINIDNGYAFKPKNKPNVLSVNKVIVLDPKLVDNILTLKFEARFKKLLKLVTFILNNEDAASGETELALDEVALLKSILLNRYQKFLSEEKELLFLQKIRILENNLRSKEYAIKMQQQECEEDKVRGR